MRKQIVLVLVLLLTIGAFGQSNNNKELSYNEFLGFVKKFHPMVKRANLELSKAQAELMTARGGFDPKIEVDFDKKQFKDKEYYSILDSSFKIPTWYGVELKAGFDNNEGYYLDPQNTTPNSGLSSLGISIPLGQGLLINQRMADLRKAKLQVKLSDSERKLQAIQILYDASVAYFNWKKNFSEVVMYENYSFNAKIRYQGILQLIKEGDKPAIDSVESGITLKSRLLSLEDSKLKLNKSKLELSNYLWLEDNIPLELSDELVPEAQLIANISETLKTNELQNNEFLINNHPKINALTNKVDMLDVDRKLKANALLPRVNVGYTYLSEPTYFDQFQFEDYKIGLDFYFPLFLRKERGSLKLAKFKIQETQFQLEVEKVQIQNKVKGQKVELESILKQNKLINELVNSNDLLLQSEERLFTFGESSLFLINTRENNLISAQLAKITLENRYFTSNAELFKIMANPD
jgi:outer membrane protein TolC